MYNKKSFFERFQQQKKSPKSGNAKKRALREIFDHASCFLQLIKLLLNELSNSSGTKHSKKLCASLMKTRYKNTSQKNMPAGSYHQIVEL